MRMIEWSDAYLKIARTFHATNKSKQLFTVHFWVPSISIWIWIVITAWGLLWSGPAINRLDRRDQCCVCLSSTSTIGKFVRQDTVTWCYNFDLSSIRALNDWAQIWLAWKFSTLGLGSGLARLNLMNRIEFDSGLSSTRLKFWSSGLARKSLVKVKRAQFKLEVEKFNFIAIYNYYLIKAKKFRKLHQEHDRYIYINAYTDIAR